MSKRTRFQTETERAVIDLLNKHGRTVESQIVEGVVPFYSEEPVRCVKLQDDDLEVWIFEDDATFRIKGTGATHERQDFESEEALREALLADIAALL